jgi:hypothetical protein
MDDMTQEEAKAIFSQIKHMKYTPEQEGAAQNTQQQKEEEEEESILSVIKLDDDRLEFRRYSRESSEKHTIGGKEVDQTSPEAIELLRNHPMLLELGKIIQKKEGEIREIEKNPVHRLSNLGMDLYEELNTLNVLKVIFLKVLLEKEPHQRP